MGGCHTLKEVVLPEGKLPAMDNLHLKSPHHGGHRWPAIT